MNKKSIKLSTLIQLFGFVLLLSVLLVYYFNGDTDYVQIETIMLASILWGVSALMLFDASRKNNPLLIVMAWWCLTFVMMRVATLNYTDFSVCLRRSGASVEDVNNSLIYTILGSVVFWIVLRNLRGTDTDVISSNVEYSPRHVKKALNVYWIAFIINVIADYGLPFSGLALIIRNFILNIYDLLYFVIAYVILVWGRLSSKDKRNVIVSLLAFAAFSTLGGSRAAFYSIFKLVFFVFLAIGYKNIKRVYIYGILIALPIALFFFMYSTYMRKADMQESGLSEKIEMIGSVIDYSEQLEPKLLLSPVFDRIGYLDYTAEMVTQASHFKKYINVGREVKSIVDNAFTPGFDIFDAPRISNIIANSYEYSDKTLSSKILNSNEDYHSDELTIYGESYVLFGYPGYLVFIFFIGIIINRIWKRSERLESVKSVFIKAIIISLFQTLLSSYGIDWLFLHIVSFVMTYLIFTITVFGHNPHTKIQLSDAHSY